MLAVCNTAMGLRLGWFDTGSLTAALLGGALLRAVGRAPSLEQHNLLQTLASSMATIPSTAGLVAAVPVLLMAGHSLSAPSLVVWATACGVWGVLWALPLRQRLLVDEKLPFPTGQATAEAITQSAAVGASGERGRLRTFLVALGLAAAFTVLRDGVEVLPQELASGLGLFGLSAAAVGLTLSLSPLSMGAGVMGGPVVGASLLGAGLVGRVVVGPWLLRAGLVDGSAEGLSAWLLWPGVGLLVGATLPSLIRLIALLRSGVGGLALSWRLGAAMAACLAVLVAVAWSWGASPVAVVLGAGLGVPLMIASTRAAGQTDVAPLAPMGQLGQAAASLVAQGPLSTVLSGAVPAGAGAHLANTFWTLRAGRLLKLADGPQLVAQVAGVVLGAVVCVPVFFLLAHQASLGSAALPVPWAAQWRAVAEVLAAGRSALPNGAGVAALVAFVAGAGVGLLEDRALPAPSAVALGLGVLLPIGVSATMAIGGALAWWLTRRKAAESVGLPLAAGLIAGESVLSVAMMAWHAVRG